MAEPGRTGARAAVALGRDMMGRRGPASYQSYLLRLWRVPGEEGVAWRASLENPQTGERRGFASLDAMVAFLRRQIGLAPDRGGEEGEQTAYSEQGGKP